jgi:hypothetical protein
MAAAGCEQAHAAPLLVGSSCRCNKVTRGQPSHQWVLCLVPTVNFSASTRQPPEDKPEVTHSSATPNRFYLEHVPIAPFRREERWSAASPPPGGTAAVHQARSSACLLSSAGDRHPTAFSCVARSTTRGAIPASHPFSAWHRGTSDRQVSGMGSPSLATAYEVVPAALAEGKPIAHFDMAWATTRHNGRALVSVSTRVMCQRPRLAV